MRKVIDSNMLQDEKLRKYLSKNKSNFAVLTDYASMEAYKGDTLKSIFKSMEILSSFPDQVIILKGTQTISRLRGRESGLTKRMICSDQTDSFPEYCKNLALAKSGSEQLKSQLLDNGRAATNFIDVLLNDSIGLLDNIKDVSNGFSKREISALRTNENFSPIFVKKFMRLIDILSDQLIRSFPGGIKPPSFKELPNTFLYRFSLSYVVFILRWIRNGSQTDTHPGKVLNDRVDINFVTYGTFFDGVMSNDKKLLELSGEVQFLLDIIKYNVSRS